MSAFRLLLRTAVPLAWGQLALAANTFVTQAALARHATSSLNASLPGSMLALAWISFFNATIGYAGTLVAQRHGDGRTDEAHGIFRLSVVIALIACPLLLTGIPAARFILGCFNTSPDVLANEVRYFEFLLPSGALAILATVFGGYFTGQGKTRLVGWSTVLGFSVNMAIAPFFIDGTFGFSNGVIGAALAQTTGNLVPCVILGLAIAFNHSGGTAAFPDSPRRNRAFSPMHAIFLILRLGLPNGVKAVLEIGGFFLFTALIAECDAIAVSASTVLFSLNGIFYSFMQGVAAAVEILVARGQVERLRRAVVDTVIGIGTLSILIISAAVLMCADAFLPHEATFSGSVYRTALLTLLPIQIVKTFLEFGNLAVQSALRGRGETAFVCRIQAIITFLVWIPAFALVRTFHPTVSAYWWTMVLSGAVSLALLQLHVRQSIHV